MRSRRSIRRSTPERRGGFSIVELIVTAGIAGITLGTAVHFFGVQLHQQREEAFRVEAQQAARSSLDAITRDLRLAGACLPGDGQFIALAGVNAPGGDSITIRTGLVRTNMSCIITTTVNDVVAGTTVLPVDAGTGSVFAIGMLAYLRSPLGPGEIQPIASSTDNTVTLSTGTTQAYPLGTGVYAIDERIYALDKSTPSNPKLTLTVNRGAPEAFAAGVADLQVNYVLNRNCPTCDQVPLPATTADWWLVNTVDLTATVQTVGGTGTMDNATLVVTSVAKPRNLLP